MSVQYITGPQASPQIIVVERNTTPKYATGDVPVEFLVPCLGLYCCTTNCYIEQPHCIGYASRCDLLCISCKGMACKLSREEGVCCACQRGTCDITSISSAVLIQQQACCLDQRCAFPTQEDTPSVLNILGFTFCYKMQCVDGCNCCVSVNTLEQKYLNKN